MLNAALAAGSRALPFRDIGDGAHRAWLALLAAGAETAKAARWEGKRGRQRDVGSGLETCNVLRRKSIIRRSGRWPKDCTRSHIMADMRAGGSAETDPHASSKGVRLHRARAPAPRPPLAGRSTCAAYAVLKGVVAIFARGGSAVH